MPSSAWKNTDRMLQYFPTTEAGMPPIPLLGASMGLAASSALAQDTVKVEPKHYQFEFENAQGRVLRIHYGAHEKSVMHYHPASVAVFLTDVHGKFTYPDGKSEEAQGKAGETFFLKEGEPPDKNTFANPVALLL